MQKYVVPHVDRIHYLFKPFQSPKRINFVRANEDFPSFDFELLISNISSRLVYCDPKESDCVIEESLQEIIDFLRIDKAAILLEEQIGSNKFEVTHFKIRSGYVTQLKPILAADSCPWIMEGLLNGREAKYSRIDDLPKCASIDKESLRRFGQKYSVLAVPLFDGDRVFGIFDLGIAEERIWPEDLVSGLRVVSHVFSGVLIRKKTERMLQKTLKELQEARAQLERQPVNLNKEMKQIYSLASVVRQSQGMSHVLSKAEQVASTNATVMLSGETGTGKEMIASAIHKMSSRAGKMMVRVNCGAIPAALVESEMFGREKGAYTGALSRQIGRFELADASTIFLDEICDLPTEAQVKLLRVLQEKEIERLGNPKPIRIDVRVIAATNQSLEKAVQEGKFREDLYYRLNVFPIEVPPLRERREDIPMLVWTFVDELCAELGKKVENISQENMETLMDYAWPGNVRELRNAIERAMIVSSSPILHIEIPKVSSSIQVSTALTLREVEIQHIRRVLENTAWKIRGKQGAAEILGMKPTTLDTKMAKLGISRPNNKNRVSDKA
jgi:transcriptional regulator with GAF, ATPase, and Fis domain